MYNLNEKEHISDILARKKGGTFMNSHDTSVDTCPPLALCI